MAFRSNMQEERLMGALRLFVARRCGGRLASLNRELQRAAGRAEPKRPALGAECAHTLVQNRAIKFLRRYRGTGELAEPGKNLFKLLPSLQFQRCPARRKR